MILPPDPDQDKKSQVPPGATPPPISTSAYESTIDPNHSSLPYETTPLLPPPAYSPPNENGRAVRDPQNDFVPKSKKAGTFGRVMRALFYALLLLFAASMVSALVMAITTGLHSGSGHTKHNDTKPDVPTDPLENESNPRNWAGDVIGFDPVSRRYNLSASFILPMGEESTFGKSTVFVHTRGPRIGGHVTVAFSGETFDENDGNVGDHEVMVRIHASSTSAENWKDLQIYQAGSGDIQGVVVSRAESSKAPEWYDTSVQFHIQIIYPQRFMFTAQGSQGTLELILSNMSVELQDTVQGMDNVKVVSTNGPIKADSIRANTVSLRTSNSKIICPRCCAATGEDKPNYYELITSNDAIEGFWCAKDYIVAQTSSAAIRGQFDAPSQKIRTSSGSVTGSFTGLDWLKDGVFYPSGVKSGLELITTNAKVSAMYGVKADGPSHFDSSHLPVHIISTNGPMEVGSAGSISDRVPLDIMVATTNNAVSYDGYKTFHGDVTAKTTNSRLVVVLKNGGVPARHWSGVAASKSLIQGTVDCASEVKGSCSGLAWSNLEVGSTNGNIRAFV